MTNQQKNKKRLIRMTDKQIKNLILTGEGYHIEFKQSLDKTLIDEVLRFCQFLRRIYFNGGG